MTENPEMNQVNEKLLEANRACVDRTVALLKMLGVCRQQFLLYEASHRAKNTEESTQKAETNANLVRDIDETLKVFRERAQAEQIPE